MRKLSCAALTIALALAGVAPASAQMSATDMVMRLEAMEHQIRQLTGQIEQLQFRNQQLEQQLKRTQDDNEFRFQELGGKGRAPHQAQPARPLPSPQQAAPQVAPQQVAPQQVAPPAALPGRRSDADRRENPNFIATPNPVRRGEQEPPDNRDVAAATALPPAGSGGARRDVFDPTENPNAPGVPRQLGSLPAGQPSAPIAADEPVGVRGGREPGAPLDIATLSGRAPAGEQPDQGGLPPPPQRNLSSTGAVAGIPPAPQGSKATFDLGYGFIQRKDYPAAEDTFREFLQTYPGDRLAADAHYWLGESLFQRQRYRDAAESFLAISTKHETSAKAPDALLRLGQSLAALRERNAACATFGEIGRKYPRASVSVKQGVEREIKRVGC